MSRAIECPLDCPIPDTCKKFRKSIFKPELLNPFNIVDLTKLREELLPLGPIYQANKLEAFHCQLTNPETCYVMEDMHRVMHIANAIADLLEGPHHSSN